MLLSFALGFLFGVIAVVAAEGLALYWLVRRLTEKSKGKVESDGAVGTGIDSGYKGIYPYEKQGSIWILDEDIFLKRNGTDVPVKGIKENRNKKGIIEVLPVKRTAEIREHSLILTDEDGLETTINLSGCTILAVSATDSPSRKWYKKYPIKVESNDSPIYNGKRTCFLYAETSSEKESWCKALRLASSSNADKISQDSLLHEEFHQYLVSLMVQHPLFLKPTSSYSDVTGNSNKVDESSSRVRHILKKLTKKVSKIGSDKSNLESYSLRGDKYFGNQDMSSLNGSSRSSSMEFFVQDVNRLTFPDVKTSDAAALDKFDFDEGTLCLNLLFSRMFFDAKRNTEIRRYLKARIQKALSNIRAPSYIGEISCTSFDLGNIPPYIQNIRALPVDMNDMLALDIDITYTGGFLLDIETRIEARGPEMQKGDSDAYFESDTGNAIPDFPQGLEPCNNHLMLSVDSPNAMKARDGDEKSDGVKQSKSGSWASAYKSRVKMILNSVADHVSQVPLSLSMKVASLQGTLRLHLKPPPSDYWWFGFTSMPEIELNLESSVGDHKFFNTQVGVLIANRIKGAFREALVLPNCEGIHVSWMLAEKNDWVPRNVAPLMWVHPENGLSSSKESPTSQTRESKGNMKDKRCCSADNIEDSIAKVDNDVSVGRRILESVTSGIDRTTSFPPDHVSGDQPLADLKMPLLKNVSFQDDTHQRTLESLEGSTTTAIVAGHAVTPSEEDAGAKRMGKRDRMISLGRKVSEKFEEKRRHMEEKRKHLVEKMKENTR